MRRNVHILRIALVAILSLLGVAFFLWWQNSSHEPQAHDPIAEPIDTALAVVLDERIGRPIEDFTLDDFYGQPHHLSDFGDKQLVVVAFLGVDCPMVQQYIPRLITLAEQFQEQVAFVGINANQQDSLTEMNAFAESHALTFPLLKDPGNVVADQFMAMRTPEVFVLDQQRRVGYWGRIDDEFGVKKGIGYQRLAAVRPDLEIAIEELLAGKAVSEPETESWGCHIGRIKESNPESEVTWSKHIVPIFQKHCQACHRPGQIAPFSLLTYEDVHGWEPMIQEVVAEGRMPPWHASPEFGVFINNPSLDDREKELLEEWIGNGAPEGDPQDLPPPKKFREGWQIANPDFVVHIDENPVVVPATGAPEFRYFFQDLGFTEGKWVEVECRPDNLAVIHHMDILVAPEGDFDEALRSGRVLRLTGYVPGIHSVEPEGVEQNSQEVVVSGGRYIPAGSQISFEMHYTPNGREQFDRSSVAFKFLDAPRPDENPGSSVAEAESEQPPPKNVSAADSKPNEPAARFEDLSVLVEYTDFCIPPGADEFPVEAWYTFENDSQLGSLHAHMHLRGKSMRFEVFYPNGDQETLLWIPRYDYDWQHVYQFAEMKMMPRGTRMHVIAIFDNSEENPRNPAPEATIVYGRGYQDEEMMAGTINFVPQLSKAESSLAEERLMSGQVNQIHEPKEIQSLLAGYTKAESVDPARLPVYFHLRGMYREGLGDLEGALEDYTAAIEADSQFAGAYQSRGTTYMNTGQRKLAERDFDQVIRIAPENDQAHVLRGRMTTDVAKALKHFARAIELNPRNPDPYYYRGLIREATGDVPGALEDYAMIIEEIHPGYTDAYLRRGSIMLTRGLDKFAMRDFDTVIRRWPTRKTKVDHQLGTVRFAQGRLEEAVPYLEAFLRVVPNDPSVEKMLGISYINLAHLSEASEHLQHVLDSDPEDIETRFYLASAYRAQASLSESVEQQTELLALAVSHLDELLQRAPENSQAIAEMADALLAQGEVRGAIAHYKSVLEIEPQAWPVMGRLAWVLATTEEEDLHNAEEAVDLANRLCQSSRNSNPEHLDILAACYAGAGRFEEACAAASRAVELAKKEGNEAMAREIGEHLERYEASQPYREANGSARHR